VATVGPDGVRIPKRLLDADVMEITEHRPTADHTGACKRLSRLVLMPFTAIF
jgi:hypothetical protein